MPCSGPRYFPAAISASACFACASASSFVQRDDAAQLRIELLDAPQIDVGQPLRGERLLLDPARQLGHRRERDVGVARRQRESPRPCCARTRSRAGPELLASEHRVPQRRRRDAPARARLCAARRAARAAAPSIARQLAAAISRSAGLIVTCASFSASANVAGETGGPDTGAVPNVGGAPGVVGAARNLERSACRSGTRPRRQRAERSGDQELSASIHGLGARFLTTTLASRQCESYVATADFRDATADVVQAFRPARHGGPEGPHCIERERRSHGIRLAVAARRAHSGHRRRQRV